MTINTADWTALAGELDAHWCALTPPLLTPAECANISGLYGETPRRLDGSTSVGSRRGGRDLIRWER